VGGWLGLVVLEGFEGFCDGLGDVPEYGCWRAVLARFGVGWAVPVPGARSDGCWTDVAESREILPGDTLRSERVVRAVRMLLTPSAEAFVITEFRHDRIRSDGS